MSLLVSYVQVDLWTEIKDSWNTDLEFQALIQDLHAKPQKYYTWIVDQLKRKEKLVIGNNAVLREKILTLWHSAPTGGHSSIDTTSRKVLIYFYWKGIRSDIDSFMK